MKKLLFLLLLATSLNAGATNWATYYVYFETEYLQGPWARMGVLENSDYKYLAPEVYEDLIGTVEEDLANKLISRLHAKKPELYNWSYDLIVKGDTVILTPNDTITNWESVKNEIIATLTLNSFSMVIFQFSDRQESLTINDLTLPYFDLHSAQTNTEVPSIEEATAATNEVAENSDAPNTQDNPYLLWLIISGILNILLVGFLVLKKNN